MDKIIGAAPKVVTSGFQPQPPKSGIMGGHIVKEVYIAPAAVGMSRGN